MNSVHDIRAMAKAQGIQMKSVCQEAKIQQSQVSRWLSGTVDPLWSSVNSLEQALFRLIQAKERWAAQERSEAQSESETP